ncbi:MAG: hypothetical protein II367_04415 [Treponema sp.]|nr:hypothetical protein [Treponema sp.]
MRILELRDLNREEGYIYYRRYFTGTAVIEIPGSTLETPVSFCIEMNSFGAKTIEIDIQNTLNYPVLPVKKALKEYILLQDAEGILP